ncbi:MAG: 4Fe-4S dicluster domain-containing protein [Clostridiales bacterium]|nr:4Fe-4S dicluster domain-containing protein [Clostridiales bacterium]
MQNKIIMRNNLKEVKNMAYKINESCIGCGACQATCPVEAIASGAPYKIDENVCIECGACAQGCPVGAIEK